MTQYRVIVVDDEILLRQGLSARLSRTADIKVVGVCSSGPSVLERLAAGSADAVVLDLEMNCSEPQPLLREIREKYPEILVLALAPSDMFLRRFPQSLIIPGRCEAIVRPRQNTTAEAFLDDLASTIRKRLVEMLRSADRARSSSVSIDSVPESRSSIIAPIQEHRSGVFTIAPETRSSLRSAASLVKEQEKAPADSIAIGSPELSSMRHSASDITMSRTLRRVEVLAIASSTGGPQALTELLADLPRDFPVPIVIVQHMPAEFTKNLADRLDATCALTVREAAAGDPLLPGQVLIAPGDQHMVLNKADNRRSTVALNQGPMENSCRPAADVLFRSVADVYGASVLGVVLTGMGKDGLAGTKVIRDAGGRVIVQDEASSIVWGMPGEIARAGLADAVLPLRELPAEIMRRMSVGRI